jgi:hypothetical protein
LYCHRHWHHHQVYCYEHPLQSTYAANTKCKYSNRLRLVSTLSWLHTSPYTGSWILAHGSLFTLSWKDPPSINLIKPSRSDINRLRRDLWPQYSPYPPYSPAQNRFQHTHTVRYSLGHQELRLCVFSLQIFSKRNPFTKRTFFIFPIRRLSSTILIPLLHINANVFRCHHWNRLPLLATARYQFVYYCYWQVYLLTPNDIGTLLQPSIQTDFRIPERLTTPPYPNRISNPLYSNYRTWFQFHLILICSIHLTMAPDSKYLNMLQTPSLFKQATDSQYSNGFMQSWLWQVSKQTRIHLIKTGST